MTGSAVDSEAFNAFEAAGWETTAGGYDDFFGQITPRPVEPLLDAAQIDRGVRIAGRRVRARLRSGPLPVARASNQHARRPEH